MSRTILYYPSITIQNPNWIKKSILYWDQIGIIIPSEIYTHEYFNQDMDVLAKNQLLVEYHPEDSVKKGTNLKEEFIESYRTLPSRPSIDFDKGLNRYKIFYGKIPDDLTEYLMEYAHARREDRWLVLGRREGLLYMGLLAKYLANEEKDSLTVPGTDYRAYQNWLFQSSDPIKNLPGVAIGITDLLPVPREDVSLEDVIEFKRKRKIELSHFQETIDEWQDKIKKAENEVELRHISVRFGDRLKNEVEELDKMFRDAKIPFILGAVENVMAIQAPALITAMATLSQTNSIPITLTIAGAAVLGAISFRKYLLDTRNTHQEKLAANSFSYLYSAQREGII